MLNYTTVETVSQKAPQLESARVAEIEPQAIKNGPSLFSIFAVLFVYYKSIIFFVILGAIGAWSVGKMLTPRFNATAQLYLDPKGIQVFENELNSSKNQDSQTGMNVVESLMRVINSQVVLKRVVIQEKLTEDEEFYKVVKPSVLQSIMAIFNPTPKKSSTPPPSPVDVATAGLFQAVIVKRAERTFIVDVTVKSEDAYKSAYLANKIISAYLDIQNENRSENSRKASSFLTSRLDELKEKVRVSEDLAETFRAKNNLIGAKGTLVGEQQLSDANFQLSSAKARVSDAQSRYEQILRAKKTGDISGIIEAINSQVVTSLRAQQSEASRRLSELSLELGVKHPQVQNAKAQMGDLSRMINEELARIAEAVKSDLERAQSTEASVSANLEKLKALSVDSNVANVQLRELEREVEANRQLYNAFLLRSRETTELEKLDTSSTRIISQANPPFRASFPPPGILLALGGLFLGGLLGVGQAFLRSILRRMRYG